MGDLEKLREAIDRGEDVNDTSFDNDTGLMWAVKDKHNSIVRLLLEQPTLDLNCTDVDGYTALHWAFDNVEAVQLLLADPRLSTANHKSNEGYTPVMDAILWKNLNALRELVAHPSVDLDIGWEGASLEEISFNHLMRFNVGLFSGFTSSLRVGG